VVVRSASTAVRGGTARSAAGAGFAHTAETSMCARTVGPRPVPCQHPRQQHSRHPQALAAPVKRPVLRTRRQMCRRTPSGSGSQVAAPRRWEYSWAGRRGFRLRGRVQVQEQERGSWVQGLWWQTPICGRRCRRRIGSLVLSRRCYCCSHSR
jgi:hypothetical protein